MAGVKTNPASKPCAWLSRGTGFDCLLKVLITTISTPVVSEILARRERGKKMKRLGALILPLTLLVVHAQAQTPTSRPVNTDLELGRHLWRELGLPGGPCSDCSLQKVVDYRWNSRKYKYIALAELRNRGAKTIKAIDIDFVFIDAATGQEFLRYRVHSDRKIGPGQKREIRQLVRDVKKENNNYSPAMPPQNLISRAEFSELKLLVTRIEYVDGSVWRQP